MPATPALTRNWQEQARTLIAAGMSVRGAARELGLPEERVKKWATRSKVLPNFAAAQAVVAKQSPVVPRAADRLANLSPDSKLKLAVALNRKAGHVSRQKPAQISPTDVLQLAKGGQIIHDWGQIGQSGPLVSLNFVSDASLLGQIKDASAAAPELPG